MRTARIVTRSCASCSSGRASNSSYRDAATSAPSSADSADRLTQKNGLARLRFDHQQTGSRGRQAPLGWLVSLRRCRRRASASRLSGCAVAATSGSMSSRSSVSGVGFGEIQTGQVDLAIPGFKEAEVGFQARARVSGANCSRRRASRGASADPETRGSSRTSAELTVSVREKRRGRRPRPASRLESATPVRAFLAVPATAAGRLRGKDRERATNGKSLGNATALFTPGPLRSRMLPVSGSRRTSPSSRRWRCRRRASLLASIDSATCSAQRAASSRTDGCFNSCATLTRSPPSSRMSRPVAARQDSIRIAGDVPRIAPTGRRPRDPRRGRSASAARSALSIRSSSRCSARDVNIRYGSRHPRVTRSSTRMPMYASSRRRTMGASRRTAFAALMPAMSPWAAASS